MELRQLRADDRRHIIAVVDDWWGGRPMAGMLPRLFFVHFQDTSFVLEDAGTLVGFLIGFVSQSDPAQAYIHFVGVHPAYRKQGIGARLYGTFFERVRQRGCETIRCITGPVNSGSIAFHTRMGFQIEPGDREADGIPVTTDYDGPGQDRVRFVKQL